MDDIEALEQELLEKSRLLAALKQARDDKVKYESDWDEAIIEEFTRSKPIRIHSPHIEWSRLYFKNDYDEALLNHLRRTPSRGYTGKENFIEMADWPAFVESITKIPRVIVDFTEDEWRVINEYKPAPDFIVRLEDEIIVDLHPRANKYKILDGIRTAKYLRNPIEHIRLPREEGWQLIEILKDKQVKYEDSAKEFIEAQLEQKHKLDTIAKNDSHEAIVLNGYKLRAYQEQAVAFAEAANSHAILAHSMGLGKTPMGIACCERIRTAKPEAKFLFIVPGSLRINTSRQIFKFTGLEAYILTGEKPDIIDSKMLLLNKYNYYIINYDIISTAERQSEGGKDFAFYPWINLLNLVTFDGVICDEIHYIKNFESNRSQALRRLNDSRLRLGLSGTIMKNHRARELWPSIQFINPNVAGSYESFVNFYEDGKYVRNIDSLRRLLSTFMIRKTTKEVMPELEEVNRITQVVELSDAARQRYNKALDGLFIELDQWSGQPTDQKAIPGILAQLMRLKQICAEDKIAFIADFVTELHDNCDEDDKHAKVLVATQFINSPPVLASIARRLGDEALYFSGDNEVRERMAIIDRFTKEDNIHFLVMSSKLSEGLDITAAGHVVFADLMWTPNDHHQVEGRAFGRIIDPHGGDSYRIVCSDTIEENIVKLLEHKENVIKEVVDGAESIRNESVLMELIQQLKRSR